MKTVVIAITLFALAGLIVARTARHQHQRADQGHRSTHQNRQRSRILGHHSWHRRGCANRTASQSRLHGLAHQRQEVRQLGRDRPSVWFQAGRRPGHQGLGRRCGRHESRWQAPVAHPAGPGLRSQGLSGGYPGQLDPHLRRATDRCEIARVARTLLSARAGRTHKSPQD